MGRGILLGGVPGVEPADVLVLGGGVVGRQRRPRGRRAGRQRRHHGHQPRPPALPGRRHARQRHDDLLRPARRPPLRGAGRPGHRRRAHPRRARPAADRPQDRQPDEDRRGHRRRQHRPGRLHRDQPAHHAPRADVHRRRRRALLRDQHPRRRRPDQHPGAVQRHPALRPRAGPAGRRQVRRLGRRPRLRRQHARGQTDQPRRPGRLPRPAQA